MVDATKPNQYSVADKVRWLNYLEGTIFEDIILTHEGGEKISFDGYSVDDLEKEMLVSKPHDMLYVAYLQMKIDEANGETARYNNSATMYNSYMSDFSKYWHRNHLPKGVSQLKIY